MSKTIIVNIRNNSFPSVSVRPETYVVWRNLDPHPHSAETDTTSNFFFNAGPMLPGETSSPVLFRVPGSVSYRCRYHGGMEGKVVVDEKASSTLDEVHDHGGHDLSHLAHLHGFVTGGRSGLRFFMSHTPVLADPRHNFQVILQGSLKDTRHIEAYNALRSSSYGDGRVQIFHSHVSLVDIGSGKMNVLPSCSFSYYPDSSLPDNAVDVPGLEEKIPVSIDKVLNFHKFDLDAEYPDGLAYLMYGDLDDQFIDHHINRAPSFHSVAKLASRPSFWDEKCIGRVLRVLVPSKKIQELPPKVLQRLAFVDNSFHIFWLPPSGLYTPKAQDPLLPRQPDAHAPFNFDVIVEGDTQGKISISRTLHFDVRLLNHGVFLPDNA